MTRSPLPATHLLDRPCNDVDAAIREWFDAHRQPAYRQQQLHEHLFDRRVDDPHAMSNLPSTLRDALRESLLAPRLTRRSRLQSRDGTRKYAFELADGALIESVLIPADDRATLCVSSQAGCAAGCTFCATGAGGFARHLTPSEILAQWLHVDADLRADPIPVDDASESRVTQIVFMGMGEPLHNYDALAIALDYLTGPFAFSPRRITVSTVGIVPKIPQLMARFPQVRLAVSLHSAVDSTRAQIVPVNRKYGLEQLRGVLVELRGSSRRITLEYVLLEGVNDADDEARALAQFASESAAHINLLPFHPFPGATYPPTPATSLRRFRDLVVASGYAGDVTIRKSRGLDIQGACGQLALHGSLGKLPGARPTPC